jgi:hypothetical protein
LAGHGAFVLRPDQTSPAGPTFLLGHRPIDVRRLSRQSLPALDTYRVLGVEVEMLPDPPA